MHPNPETNNARTSQARTSDEQVAQMIVHDFSAGDLIAPSQIPQLLSGLAAGSLRAEDWRRLAENALDLEARHDKITP